MPMNEYGEIIRNSSAPPPIPETSNNRTPRRSLEDIRRTLHEIERINKRKRRRKIIISILVLLGIGGIVFGTVTIMHKSAPANSISANSSDKTETMQDQSPEPDNKTESISNDSTENNSDATDIIAKPDTYDLSKAIEIKDFQGLNKIRNNLSGTYVLTTDIDLSKCNWEPIGTLDKPFSGILIGNGYEIKGLKLDISTSETCDAGLFGVIDGGTISDVRIKSKIKLTCKGPNDSFANAGGICGRLISGTIERCTVTGSINTIGKKGVYVRSGGVAGDISHSSIIVDCEVDAKVCASAKDSNTMVGGVAGWLENSRVERCLIKGQLSGKNSKSYTYAGGINGSGSFAEVHSSVVLYKKIKATGEEVYLDLISPYAASENNLVLSTRDNNNTLSGTLISSKEKKKEETYTELGWDFDNVWKMKLFSTPTLQH